MKPNRDLSSLTVCESVLMLCPCFKKSKRKFIYLHIAYARRFSAIPTEFHVSLVNNKLRRSAVHLDCFKKRKEPYLISSILNNSVITDLSIETLRA